MIAFLANHLWQSTLVAILAWAATLALRRDRAGVRYAIWLAASLKFLVPFSALMTFGARFGWRPMVVASFVPYQMMVETAGDALPSRAVRFVVAPAPAASMLHRAATMLPELLLGLWALGALALAAVWWIRWRRVALVVRTAAPVGSGPIVETLRRLEARVGLRRPIALAASASSLEPGVFGVIAPTLVWPTQIEAHLSAAQIDAILAHEVTHVRRRDNLASVAHMAVQALFWFHPIVWWMASRLVDERERACDEDVIRRLGHDRVVYAESILKTCRFLAASPVPCVAGVTGSNLKKRIEHIMTGESHLTLSPWKKALLAVTAAAAIAAPFLLGVMTVKPLLAQEPSTTAAFDSTSVKANTSGAGMIQMLPAANRGWQATNVTLGFLVRMAFQLQDDQIVGGPNWLFEDRFDVMGTGTAPGRDGSLFNKVRSMLADRFHLATHTETRELPIFALVMARGDGALGSKLTKSTADCSPQANGAGRGLLNLGERPRCGFRIGPGSLDVGGQTMALFAQNLSRFVGGIVVDRTNLAGTFDIALAYAPQSARNPAARDLPGAPPPGPPTDGNDAPSIFTALVEQLGLKLEATRGPVEVVVIDRAEHPAAN